MYNSLFWSISPQDAVTQGGFLVDIVDDDIPHLGQEAKRTQNAQMSPTELPGAREPQDLDPEVLWRS